MQNGSKHNAKNTLLTLHKVTDKIGSLGEDGHMDRYTDSKNRVFKKKKKLTPVAGAEMKPHLTEQAQGLSRNSSSVNRAVCIWFFFFFCSDFFTNKQVKR